MEVNQKVEQDSSDLPRVPDAHVNPPKNDSPSASDISDDESSSESSDAPKLPPKPVKPRRSRTSMLASFGYDINDAVKVSSVFTALDEREAAEQERKRQEKEAKRLRREKLRQERERKQTEREEKSQREHEELNNKSIADTNDGSLPPISNENENEQPIQNRTTSVPNGEVRPNVIILKAEQQDTNGELPRKKRKYVRKPKGETEAKEGKEKKRPRKDSEDTKPRKKRRKDSEENGDELTKEGTKKKRRRKETNGDDEKPKRRKKKVNNNNDTSERSDEEPKKKRRKKKKEDDVSHDKSDSANSTKKSKRGRKPKRENSKKSEAENEKSESERATRGSKDEDDSSESGDEWTLIEEDLLPGDTLTIFSKQVFNETIKKHAKTAAARALDRGYGFPMVPFKKLKPKYKPRKGLYECINQLAVNEQIAVAAPLTKGRKEFRIPYGPDNENGLSSSIEEDDKRLNGSRKIQHPKKRLLSHLRTSSDGSKQSDLAQDEVDNFVKINTAESM